MPDAGVLATILLIVGLFLISLELMIPSFGMIGIMAAITLLISAWCAWQAWWGTSPGFFWTYAAFWILGIPGVLGGMLYMLQHSRLGDHIVLKGPQIQESESETSASTLVGEIGNTSSPLMPGGIVIVDGERYHAEGVGMMIDANTAIEVVSVEGNRLKVRKASEEQIAAHRARREAQATADTMIASNESDSSANSDTLDFEIPEG